MRGKCVRVPESPLVMPVEQLLQISAVVKTRQPKDSNSGGVFERPGTLYPRGYLVAVELRKEYYATSTVLAWKTSGIRRRRSPNKTAQKKMHTVGARPQEDGGER